MKLVGLTGTIGAGKSTVSAYLAKLGARIVDADLLSRRAAEPGSLGAERIRAAFGDSVFFEDGTLDRKKVASIVFADDTAREKLNGALHPVIFSMMETEIETLREEDPDGMIVLDVPLLFESGWDERVEETLVVTAQEEVCLARVIARDGCTREAAKARLDAQ
ncbi:MAG: dephospho-CoA kinase, partial [Clostridia bacterium]|nr:dephospho-CoA kinase [Clostridia bacterium]